MTAQSRNSIEPRHPDGLTIAMVVIAKNEADNVDRCFGSFWDHVDQVVLVDTGSTDDTVAIAERFASERNESDKLIIGHFTWIGDFAAARNYADSLATTAFKAWCDLDDVIQGAASLRMLAEQADERVLAFLVGYDYAQDEHGNSVCYHKRERLVRAGVSTWEGRVHEAQAIPGAMVDVGPDVCEWVHQKDFDGGPNSNRRNLKILRAWAKEEPDNPRVLAYLGTEQLTAGKPHLAVRHLRRYLRLRTAWDQERAQVHRKLAVALGATGEYPKAIETAFEALELLPSWPDSYLTLAEAYHELGEYPKAIEWAREVLRRGAPDTPLIVNPLDYTFTPRLVLASSLSAIGEIDEAIEVAEAAMEIIPNHGPLLEGYRDWAAKRKREKTAQTFIAAAQQLVRHDEQLKALTLLEDTVPYFATDHPMVVGARSEIRERLAKVLEPGRYRDFYASLAAGATEQNNGLPVWLIADEDVDAVANSVPRCRFLLAGVLEQLGVSAA